MSNTQGDGGSSVRSPVNSAGYSPPEVLLLGCGFFFPDVGFDFLNDPNPSKKFSLCLR